MEDTPQIKKTTTLMLQPSLTVNCKDNKNYHKSCTLPGIFIVPKTTAQICCTETEKYYDIYYFPVAKSGSTCCLFYS